MNREIKFRAWHPQLETMYYDCIVHPRGWIDGSTHRSGEHGTLMQFTGLRDKNGEEIYEGDIVKYTWQGKVGEDSLGRERFVDEVEIHEIVWDLGFCFDSHGLPHDAYPLSCLTEDDDFEIIGNRYENPELLETAK